MPPPHATSAASFPWSRRIWATKISWNSRPANPKTEVRYADGARAGFASRATRTESSLRRQSSVLSDHGSL